MRVYHAQSWPWRSDHEPSRNSGDSRGRHLVSSGIPDVTPSAICEHAPLHTLIMHRFLLWLSNHAPIHSLIPSPFKIQQVQELEPLRQAQRTPHLCGVITPYSGRDLWKVTPVILHEVVSPDHLHLKRCTVSQLNNSPGLVSQIWGLRLKGKGKGAPCGFYMKRDLNYNLSGNEVYYTACSLLVMLKNSCSKRHCQKGNLNPFSYKIVPDQGHDQAGIGPTLPTHCNVCRHIAMCAAP